MKTLLSLLLFLLSGLAYAQDAGSLINQSDAPARDAFTRYFYKSGQKQYICAAPRSAISTFNVTNISQATNAVFTVAGHGFHPASNPVILISDAAGQWSPLNGGWVATITGPDTFTIPLNTSGFAAFTGSITITTEAPRLTQQIWKIQQILTDVSGDIQAVMWAANGYSNACTNREVASYQ